MASLFPSAANEEFHLGGEILEASNGTQQILHCCDSHSGGTRFLVARLNWRPDNLQTRPRCAPPSEYSNRPKVPLTLFEGHGENNKNSPPP
jgi:hypothetical protein